MPVNKGQMHPIKNRDAYQSFSAATGISVYFFPHSHRALEFTFRTYELFIFHDHSVFSAAGALELFHCYSPAGNLFKVTVLQKMVA